VLTTVIIIIIIIIITSTEPFFTKCSGLAEQWPWQAISVGLFTQLGSGDIRQMALAYSKSSGAWVSLDAGG